MTVKLNRLGNIFRKEFLFTFLFIIFELIIISFISIGNISVWIFGLFIVCITISLYFVSFPGYFTAENKVLKYQRQITFPDNGGETDIQISFGARVNRRRKESAEITFCVEDIYSIEISQTPAEKIFRMGRVSFQGHMFVLPLEYEGRVASRAKHTFYGIANPEDFANDMRKCFPGAKIIENFGKTEGN